MKRILGIIALVLFLGGVFTSCTPHKQACAAYSEVEAEAPAE